MRGKRYIYIQDLWPLAVVSICSCFSHLGLWVMAIDQRNTEWLLPSLSELMSVAKKNPHFLLFLKGLAVQFRNAAIQKQIASGRGRKTKLGERCKRGRKGYEFKRGMRHTKLHVWKSNGPWQKKTKLVYCRKQAGNSRFSEEREHGRNEGIDEHADHVNSWSLYGTGGSWLMEGAYLPDAVLLIPWFSVPSRTSTVSKSTHCSRLFSV